MDELTIIIDTWGHKELKEYLMSLTGILEVVIKDEEQLEIYIKYDSNLIKIEIIRMEIFMFLDILQVPSVLAFDKHSTVETTEYKIIRKDICCEYCFRGAIDDLFMIKGIEQVNSNFNEKDYYRKKYEERENIIINIKYNPNLISLEKMQQIESNLNL